MANVLERVAGAVCGSVQSATTGLFLFSICVLCNSVRWTLNLYKG